MSMEKTFQSKDIEWKIKKKKKKNRTDNMLSQETHFKAKITD